MQCLAITWDFLDFQLHQRPSRTHPCPQTIICCFFNNITLLLQQYYAVYIQKYAVPTAGRYNLVTDGGEWIQPTVTTHHSKMSTNKEMTMSICQLPLLMYSNLVSTASASKGCFFFFYLTVKQMLCILIHMAKCCRIDC